MNILASTVEIIAGLLTLCGIAYGIIALVAARSFVNDTKRRRASVFTPGVSILKPLKGNDPRMYAGFVSHCEQHYSGQWEIVFGVRSLDDAAVAAVARLRIEYPHLAIRLVECPEQIGSNGKVSSLVQMLPHAAHEYVVVNDSDIVVGPHYLAGVLGAFEAADSNVGLVTVPYIGRAEDSLWARLEALGIATDFMPGVLTARKLEGGIRFGLGSTLATTKAALAAIGGFEALADQLADDYEMGVRISAAGYRMELAHEVVQTSVPAYTLRGFCEHQLRWSRSTRDSRRGGYIGLGVTYMLPWSLAAMVASGGAMWSFLLLCIALLVRIAVALNVGVGVLRDEQVLRDLLLLPLRDCFGLFFWAWSYASDVVVWRGEKFRLQRGALQRIG